MQYAETDVVAKYGVNPASWKVPNVRTLVKPLLGLFYAEPGSKRWKAALDIVLKQVRACCQAGMPTAHSMVRIRQLLRETSWSGQGGQSRLVQEGICCAVRQTGVLGQTPHGLAVSPSQVGDAPASR